MCALVPEGHGPPTLPCTRWWGILGLGYDARASHKGVMGHISEGNTVGKLRGFSPGVGAENLCMRTYVSLHKGLRGTGLTWHLLH